MPTNDQSVDQSVDQTAEQSFKQSNDQSDDQSSEFFDPSAERDVLPKHNSEYARHEYWESRFAEEESFDWLTDYSTLKESINQLIDRSDRILMIGCGNSDMSAAMYDDGYTNIVNCDYSSTVIDNQSIKNAHRPNMQWKIADFTKLQQVFQHEEFDVVLDKCSMDALVVDSGDVWCPNQSTRTSVKSLLAGVSDVLKPGGCFISISFTQPHFKRRYLQNKKYNWSCNVQTVGDGILASFVYTMIKGDTCEHWPHSDSDSDSDSDSRPRVKHVVESEPPGLPDESDEMLQFQCIDMD